MIDKKTLKNERDFDLLNKIIKKYGKENITVSEIVGCMETYEWVVFVMLNKKKRIARFVARTPWKC